MTRSLTGSWRRGMVQVGLLAGVGAAFVGTEPGRVVAAPMPCQMEGGCTIKKPRLMFVAEYSTAMNQPFDADTTRWEAVREAIEAQIDFDNGYVAENFILGLARFGSDPDPRTPGTPIEGAGLVDGVALDVAWYDPNDPAKKYVECTNGDEIIAALEGLPAPGPGIGSWAKGGLEFTKAYLASADADHPEDGGKRFAAVMLLSAGVWTDPSGTKKLGPASEHPKLAAGELFMGQGVPTFVHNFGGQAGKLVSDPVALAGGTEQVIAADDLVGVLESLKQIIVKVANEDVFPVCEPDLPRVMFVLDGSSSLLNVDGVRAGPGLGAWDQIREVLAGEDSVLRFLLPTMQKMDSVHLPGLTVFGDDEPAEDAVLVQYGLCPRRRIDWALDPASSCVAPGCVDPYAAPPISWTAQDGDEVDPPNFGETVISHMPRCDADGQQPGACAGSGRYTHLGLLRVESNLEAYRSACLLPDAKQPCDAQTEFYNVLITDGKYDSTDAQVQARLVALFNAGVVTHVIGYGAEVDAAQLQAMADWGSGDALDAALVADPDALRLAITGLFKAPVTDPCCSFADCAVVEMFETGDDEGWEAGEETGATTEAGTTESSGAVDETTGTTSGTSAGSTSGSEGGESTSGAPEPTTGGVEPVPTSGGPVDPTNAEATTEAGSSSSGAPEVSAGDGCGCNSGGGGALGLLGLAGLLRRRRR